MRYINNGACYTVQVSSHDVAQFNSQWPCSSIPTKPCFFMFDRNGLFDTNCSADGPEVLALMEDCEIYAGRRRSICNQYPV